MDFRWLFSLGIAALLLCMGEPEKALFEVFLENGGSTTSTIVVATLIVILSLWMMFLGK